MPKAPVNSRRIKRRTVRTAIIALLAVVALAAVIIIAKYLLQSGTESAKQAAIESSTKVASQISDLLSPTILQVQTQLRQLAVEDAIVQLFKTADQEAMAAQAQQYLKRFYSALNIRFFLKGNYELDYEAKPSLGFASIELLKSVEKSQAASIVESHNPGSDDEHLVFIEPVFDAEQTLLGMIHLAMPASLYQGVVDAIQLPGGYAVLQQSVIGGTVDLIAIGDKQFKLQQPTAKVDVPGSRWRVAHWSESAGAGEAMSMGSLIAALIALILAALGAWFYLSKAKTKDDIDYLEEVDDGVIYQGAVKAIMDGAHPGMEKLIRHLPKVGQSRSINLNNNDDDDALSTVPDVLTQDTFDITAAAEPEPEPPPPPPPKPVAVDPSIFRAYDIRGIVGHTLTAEVVEAIGKAIGSEALARKQTAIAVGRDGRSHGPELVEALIKGIAASGMNVMDIGMVPTPVLYFAAHHLKVNSGVMLTGSHNPPDYNGMKIVLDGNSLSGSDITDLRDRIANIDFASGQGEVTEVDIKSDYIRRITDDIPVAIGKSMKIVIDAGNGVAGALAPELFRALGHEIIEQYCDVDGSFPNHHPDPSQPENLDDLIKRVKAEKADIGFAFDGDGDRLGVVDQVGNIIWPDRQMILLAEDVLSRNPGATIIYDVKCTRNLKNAIEAAGGKPLMWKTGHSLIKTKMKEVDAPLAGEMSGHIFFKERWYGFDDALYTGARMLEILLNNELNATEVFAFIPEDVSTPELRVRLDEMEHAGFMEEMLSQAKFKGAKVVDIDGLRADYPDGWGLVRPSNTSPYLVMRFEAENEEILKRIQNDFKQQMLKVKSDLDMPF